MEDIALDMRLRLERDTQTPDRADYAPAHDDILGHDAADHLRLVAEQKRTAIDVALDLAIDLDLALRGDITRDAEILADDRGDHLARSGAWALACVGCGPLGEGRLQFARTFAPIFVILSPDSGFLVNMTGTSPSQL